MIYLDHSSCTPVRKEVLKTMLPYFSERFGNPSSLNNPGKEAKEALDNAREKTAKVLNCSSSEIIFTSTGTESINLALKGLYKDKKHIITQKTEHPAVLETCKFLETHGFKVTYLDVDKDGIINLSKLENSIIKDTFLISIMYANNEIGTIQDVKAIAKIAHKHNVLFHTDACQASLLNLDVKDLGVDLLTINSTKLYGPKGAALLYKKNSIKMKSVMQGGGQENNLRSGTHNIPAIVGFASALELIQKEKDKENKRLTELRNKIIQRILKEIPNTELNGHNEKRLANNVNIYFKDIEADSLLLKLNDNEIYASIGSACSSAKSEPSHVIKAIKGEKAAKNSIRFSLGKLNKESDVDVLIETLKTLVKWIIK